MRGEGEMGAKYDPQDAGVSLERKKGVTKGYMRMSVGLSPSVRCK